MLLSLRRQSRNRRSCFLRKRTVQYAFYRLQIAERCNCLPLVPKPTSRRVSGFIRRRSHVLGVRCQLWVITNPNWRPVQGQSNFPSHLDCTNFYEDHWSGECPKHVPKRGGHCTVNGLVEVCALVLGLYRRHLPVHGKKSKPDTDRTGTTVESWHVIELKNASS